MGVASITLAGAYIAMMYLGYVPDIRDYLPNKKIPVDTSAHDVYLDKGEIDAWLKKLDKHDSIRKVHTEDNLIQSLDNYKRVISHRRMRQQEK